MSFSQKFFIMHELAKAEGLSQIVPPYIVLQPTENNSIVTKLKNNTTYILRSSLFDEGKIDRLQSGKSLSFRGINDQESFLIAYKKVIAQENLDEVILQEEFPFEDHLTIYLEINFCYAEIKNGDNASIVVISDDFVSGEYKYISYIQALMKIFKNVYPGQKFLVEAGVKKDSFKIFQANVVSDKLPAYIFSNDLIFKIIRASEGQKTQKNFLSLMHMEWKAHKFRRNFLKQNQFSIYDSFNNWSFIFHYFFLFCRIKKIPATDQAFADFLCKANIQGPWPGKFLLMHVQIASCIRQCENEDGDPDLDAGFRLTGPQEYFLGIGKREGLVGKIGHLCEKLIPEEIYQLSPDKIILSQDCHILGHGFLVAMELGIPVIGNMPRHKFLELKNEHFLSVDFAKKVYVIK